MSRRSSPTSNKVLLDTSFLLPVLGFETSSRVMEAFQKLSTYDLHYNDISILEALWKIVKIVEKTEDQISRIKEGIKAIRDTMKYAPVDEKAIESAIHMYKLGHRDMVDNLLYSIATSKGLKLLTVDENLVEFVKKHDFAKENIMLPEKLE